MNRTARRARPEWLRIGSIALVFAGGTVGAGAREALTVALPFTDPLPIAILIANLLGAFLLGLLLEMLAHDTGSGAARARLLLGTGLLGGFTTYSALALAVTQLLAAGLFWYALAYGLGTVVLGALATWGGIAAGAAARRSRRDDRGAGGDRV